MMLEVWRVHPDNSKLYSEIMQHNSEHYQIHSLYYRQLLEITTSQYLVRKPYKVVKGGGFFVKCVYELIDSINTDRPSLFISTQECDKLIASKVFNTL